MNKYSQYKAHRQITENTKRQNFIFWLIFVVLGISAILINKSEASVTQPNKSFQSGTGFYINKSCNMVTAAHVVTATGDYQISQIVIKTSRGIKKATIVAIDNKLDVAVLQVNDTDCTPVTFSLSVSPGTDIYTVGYPAPDELGFSLKITKGSVQALPEDNRLLIDSTVFPGSSGGPTFNESGGVIGLVSAYWIPAPDYVWLIPTEEILQVVGKVSPTIDVSIHLAKEYSFGIKSRGSDIYRASSQTVFMIIVEMKLVKKA